MNTATLPCPFCTKLNRIDLTRLASGPKCAECGRPFLLDRPIKLTVADLDRGVAGSDVPVLVDFYADWCGPCKIMAPVLDDLARSRQGTLLVGKLDTDRNPQSSARFEVRNIPTLILFRAGQEAARQTGAAQRATLEAMIDQRAS
jgi:thioredoxin 2